MKLYFFFYLILNTLSYFIGSQVLKQYSLTEAEIPTVYVSKSTDTACFLIDSSISLITTTNSIFETSLWNTVLFPKILKIDSSTLDYFNKENKQENIGVSSDNIQTTTLENPFEIEIDDSHRKLVIEFTPYAVTSTDSKYVFFKCPNPLSDFTSLHLP